ncbi:MAG: trimeric intracellular cation channel family protein [Pseudomonadota bacterium]
MLPWLSIIDLAGTFVFAASGAAVGIRRDADLFGVLVLSFAAATAGGMARDVFIGATPPVALADWRYLATACSAGVIVFYREQWLQVFERPVRMLDAAGLSLFVVAGTAKALNVGLTPTSAVLLGVLSGIGGGLVRDVLVAEVPVVLRSDLYASAALVGAAIVALAHVFALPRIPAMAVGALVCFGLRFMAIRYRWRLPRARRNAPNE